MSTVVVIVIVVVIVNVVVTMGAVIVTMIIVIIFVVEVFILYGKVFFCLLALVLIFCDHVLKIYMQKNIWQNFLLLARSGEEL